MLIRNVLSHQHRLMSDIRNVLKTIAKVIEFTFALDRTVVRRAWLHFRPLGLFFQHEEMDDLQRNNGLNFQSYTTTYKKFSESMSSVIRDLLVDEGLEVSYIDDIKDQCSGLLEEIQKGRIYEDLVRLAQPLSNITSKEPTSHDAGATMTGKRHFFI